MFSQKLLAEIIVPLAEYPSIYEEQTLQDVIDKMLESYSGPPARGLKQQEMIVLNSYNALVGLISIKDVLKALEPKLFAAKSDNFAGVKSDYSDISILWEEPFFHKCGKTLEKKVHDACTPFDLYAKDTDSILKVLSLMITTNKDLLPVKNVSTVIGVVHLGDVFAKVVNCCMMPLPNSATPSEE